MKQEKSQLELILRATDQQLKEIQDKLEKKSEGVDPGELTRLKEELEVEKNLLRDELEEEINQLKEDKESLNVQLSHKNKNIQKLEDQVFEIEDLKFKLKRSDNELSQLKAEQLMREIKQNSGL